MRSHFLKERCPETAPRPLASIALDRELIGLCLIMALVIGGHLIPQQMDNGGEPVSSTVTLTMIQP